MDKGQAECTSPQRRTDQETLSGLDQPPKYVSPTLTYNYERDYSFKKKQHVSILILDGRVSVPYQEYDKHVAWIQHGAEIGAAKLYYDKTRKQF
ncbi:MAG: hypothetical protein PVSMB2_34050 [Ktedonobacteraceae bacterium]